MSMIIRSIEQSTAKMLKAEKERFIHELYIAGIISKAEYEILKGEVL